MISELNKDDFYKCNRLVNEKGQLEVKAVIATFIVLIYDSKKKQYGVSENENTNCIV